MKKGVMSKKEIFSYAMGLFGFQAIVGFVASYQSMFYNKTMNASLTAIGALILIAKFLSALLDPVIGRMIDKTNGKKGKLRPFILYSAVPLVILTVLLFTDFNIRGAGLLAYMFFIYTLWSVAMSMGDIPSSGLSAVITTDNNERTNVISFANTLKSIGYSAPIVVFTVFDILAKKGFISEYLSYWWTSVLVSLLGVGMFILIYFNNKERVEYKESTATFKEMAKIVAKNKPFMLLLLTYVLGFARQLSMGIQLQTAEVILGGESKLLILGLPTAIGTMIGMALIPLLLKKYNERQVFIGYSIYGFVISVITFFVGYSNLLVMIPFLLLLGIQFGSINILPQLMTADCVDNLELQSGERTEGITYSVLAFAIKMALAISLAIGLIVIDAFGYKPNSLVENSSGKLEVVINMTKSERNWLYFTYTIIPGISSLLSVIPIFFYKLVGDKKKEMIKALEEKRGE